MKYCDSHAGRIDDSGDPAGAIPGPQQSVDQMLAGLSMTEEERRFARYVGGQIAETVADVYHEACRRGPQLDEACMTAAAAVALMMIQALPPMEMRLAA